MNTFRFVSGFSGFAPLYVGLKPRSLIGKRLTFILFAFVASIALTDETVTRRPTARPANNNVEVDALAIPVRAANLTVAKNLIALAILDFSNDANRKEETANQYRIICNERWNLIDRRKVIIR